MTFRQRRSRRGKDEALSSAGNMDKSTRPGSRLELAKPLPSVHTLLAELGPLPTNPLALNAGTAQNQNMSTDRINPGNLSPPLPIAPTGLRSVPLEEFSGPRNTKEFAASPPSTPPAENQIVPWKSIKPSVPTEKSNAMASPSCANAKACEDAEPDSDCESVPSSGKQNPASVQRRKRMAVREEKRRQQNLKLKPVPKIQKKKTYKGVRGSGKEGTSQRYWGPEEHKRFMFALQNISKHNFVAISRHVGTRNKVQCRTHHQKWGIRLIRETVNEVKERIEQDKLLSKFTSNSDRELLKKFDNVGGVGESSLTRTKASVQKPLNSLPRAWGILLLSEVTVEVAKWEDKPE